MTILVLGGAGAALFAILLLHHPVAATIGAVGAAGLWGLLGILLLHGIQLIPETLALQVLLPRKHRKWALYWISWIGEAVATLLPMTTVGGDLVRARLLAKRDVPAPVAAAAVLVDLTLSVVVQVTYTVIGLALLFLITRRFALAAPVIGGSALLLLGAGGFYWVQQHGLFRSLAGVVARFAKGNNWQELIQRSDVFDLQVQDLYRKYGALLGNAVYTFVCWLLSAGEVWIALHALGIKAGLAHACILESVARAIRAGTFIVPGALGVQEGGYVVVGKLLGIGPEASMTLALIRRARELLVGVPGLIIWQWVEGRGWWRQRAEAVPAVASAP